MKLLRQDAGGELWRMLDFGLFQSFQRRLSVHPSPKNRESKRQARIIETIVTPARLAYALIPVLIGLVTFLAFLPVLQNGFVNWDDGAFLLNNSHYRGLGWQQLRWMFTTCYLGSCMPLNYVTYGFDYVVWGMNPFGYHLSSLVIHASNAVVFYFLSLLLLRLAIPFSAAPVQVPIRLTAGVAALVFSLHPLRVEVVAWTLGREIAVAGFFFFLTLICYLKAAENDTISQSRRWRWMSAACIFYALSLLGKEAALTLPFALLVLDVYPLKRAIVTRKGWFEAKVSYLWWEKLPFLIVAAAAAIRAVLAKGQSGTLYPWESYGLLPRFAQVLYSLAFYTWKTLVPIALSPLYPLHPFAGLWDLPFLLSSVLVLSLSLGLFIYRRRWPAGFAAWLFYVILLIPVSGVVAFGPYAAADRFSYIPCALWAVLPGAALLRYWKLGIDGGVGRRTFAQFAAVMVVATLGTLTWQQSQVWKNSEYLWRHALSIEEASSFAHNNLGLALADRGAVQEAIKEFRRAVQIDPIFVEAHTNLGNFLDQTGSREEAIVHLRRALQIEPGFVNAHNTLGNILTDGGALDEAVQHFREALRQDPTSAMTHYNLARALAKRGDFEEATAQYRRALEIDPGDSDIHNNLGVLFVSRGDVDQAIQQFNQAVKMNPQYAKAYFNLGKTYAQQGRLDEAVASFRQALQLQPGVAEIHENLARALALQGEKDQAAKHFAVALRILKAKLPSP